MEADLSRWGALPSKRKREIDALLQRLRREGRNDHLRLKTISQKLIRLKTTDAIAEAGILRERAAKLDHLSEMERRALLKTGKDLLSRNRELFDQQERGQLVELVANIRKGIAARWWEFWL